MKKFFYIITAMILWPVVVILSLGAAVSIIAIFVDPETPIWAPFVTLIIFGMVAFFISFFLLHTQKMVFGSGSSSIDFAPTPPPQKGAPLVQSPAEDTHRPSKDADGSEEEEPKDEGRAGEETETPETPTVHEKALLNALGDNDQVAKALEAKTFQILERSEETIVYGKLQIQYEGTWSGEVSTGSSSRASQPVFEHKWFPITGSFEFKYAAFSRDESIAKDITNAPFDTHFGLFEDIPEPIKPDWKLIESRIGEEVHSHARSAGRSLLPPSSIVRMAHFNGTRKITQETFGSIDVEIYKYSLDGYTFTGALHRGVYYGKKPSMWNTGGSSTAFVIAFILFIVAGLIALLIYNSQ